MTSIQNKSFFQNEFVFQKKCILTQREWKCISRTPSVGSTGRL